MKKAELDKKENLWVKCSACDQIVYKKELDENYKICPKCNHYLRMSAKERLEMLVDKKDGGELEFTELDANLISQDPLQFSDASSTPVKQKSSYLSKLESEQKRTGFSDAVVCGEGTIGGHRVVLSVMDFGFMGGSMGSVVGEKVTRAIERSLELKVPFIVISASGGARMQEGILSLMQMAKTSAALARLHESAIPVISILCDPTTGGVTASFSM